MDHDEFHVTVTDDDVDTIVSVRGEVDIASSPTLRSVIAAVQAHLIRDAAGRPLVIDMSGVTFIDASGVGVLVDTARWVRRDGRTLVLRDPSPRTMRVLKMTRLLPIFHIEVGGSEGLEQRPRRRRRARHSRARASPFWQPPLGA